MAQDDVRKRAALLGEHEKSVDALHHALREHTAPEHHERLAHAVEGVKKALHAIEDDDAFGSPGIGGY